MKRTLWWLVTALMLGLAPATSMAQQTPEPTSTVAPDAEEVGEYDGPQGDIGVHWVVEGLGDAPGAPVVASDLVLVRQGWSLVAYSQDTGEVAWEYSRGGGLSDAVADDSRVYVTGRFEMIALDIASGEEVWETNLWFGREAYTVDPQSAGLVSPAVVDGVVYAVAGPLGYAFDASTGDYLWRQALPDFEALTTPVVTTSAVVFSGRIDESRQTSVALEREDGALLWPRLGEDGSFAPALRGSVAHDDLVLALDTDGDIVARNATTGGYNWYVGCDTPGGSAPRIVIVDGEVLVTCSGQVRVLDLLNGDRQYELRGVDAMLIGAFGPLVAYWDDAGSSDFVRVIDPGSGDEVWAHDFPVSEPGTRIMDGTIGNGRVFVTVTGDDGARLLAIGGTEGAHGAPLPVLLNPPAAGTFVSIATETDLRAAPSTDAAVWATLPSTTQVLITGAVEEVDGVTWWEVVLPETGDIGWVEPAAFDAAGDD